jgi:hypothetical protein
VWILRIFLNSGAQVELFYKGQDFARRDESALLTEIESHLMDDYGKTLHVGASDMAAFVVVDWSAEMEGMEFIARTKIDLNAKMQRAAAAKAGMLSNGPRIIDGGDFHERR